MVLDFSSHARMLGEGLTNYSLSPRFFCFVLFCLFGFFWLLLFVCLFLSGDSLRAQTPLIQSTVALRAETTGF